MHDMKCTCTLFFVQHVQTSIKMLDYLMKKNMDRLREQFKRFNIDPSPESCDMIFIKEMISFARPGTVILLKSTGNDSV